MCGFVINMYDKNNPA